MSPRSAFEEISQYRAPAHILSAVVLVPPSLYTVQRHIHSLHCELSGGVTLTGHCTYSQSQNYIIYLF